jgi:hypothetical protein
VVSRSTPGPPAPLVPGVRLGGAEAAGPLGHRG